MDGTWRWFCGDIVMYCIRIRNCLYRDIIVIMGKILWSYHIVTMSVIPTPSLTRDSISQVTVATTHDEGRMVSSLTWLRSKVNCRERVSGLKFLELGRLVRTVDFHNELTWRVWLDDNRCCSEPSLELWEGSLNLRGPRDEDHSRTEVSEASPDIRKGWEGCWRLSSIHLLLYSDQKIGVPEVKLGENSGPLQRLKGRIGKR